jgi:hypothetical protein
MRTTRRVLTVFIGAFIVVLIWSWIARTPWAGTVDSLTAGEGFTHPIDSIRMLAGALLVAIPAVLLIRSGWAWFARVFLGREVRRRVPVGRTPDGIRRSTS